MFNKKERLAKLKDDRERLVQWIDALLQDVYVQRSVYECHLKNATNLVDTVIEDAQLAGRDYSSVIR